MPSVRIYNLESGESKVVDTASAGDAVRSGFWSYRKGVSIPPEPEAVTTELTEEVADEGVEAEVETEQEAEEEQVQEMS